MKCDECNICKRGIDRSDAEELYFILTRSAFNIQDKHVPKNTILLCYVCGTKPYLIAENGD